MGRDSNPRYLLGYTRFPGVPVRPLRHPSVFCIVILRTVAVRAKGRGRVPEKFVCARRKSRPGAGNDEGRMANDEMGDFAAGRCCWKRGLAAGLADLDRGPLVARWEHRRDADATLRVLARLSLGAAHLPDRLAHLLGDSAHLADALSHVFGNSSHVFGALSHLKRAPSHPAGALSHLFRALSHSKGDSSCRQGE